MDYYKYHRVLLAILLLLGLVSCGGSKIPPDTTPPTVILVSPADSATGVSVSTQVDATFSENMDCTTLVAGVFTLDSVGGTVSCSGNSASFIPSANLAYNTSYTATITTAAQDQAGNALASNYSWSFTTVQTISLSWNANRETAVNSAGGGYTVYYSTASGFSIGDTGVTTVDVPYVSGAQAPTSTAITLVSSTYYFKIVAYSALNPPGGSSGSQSQLSTEVTIAVP